MEGWPQEVLDTPIAELERCGLSLQTINSLENWHGLYLRDILGKSREQLNSVHPMDRKRYARIMAAVALLASDAEGSLG